MFYRDISLPAIVEIGENIANDVSPLLRKNHIYFEKIILFTQKILMDIYQDYIPKDIFLKIVYIEGGKFEEIDEIQYEESFRDALFVAFGGGSVIDFVKVYGTKYHNPFISMPSTLSNDAIYSPIARLSEKGVKKSFGVTAPIGIIVDTKIISQSPEILIQAGVGDLVSNLSAVKDCMLGIEIVGEKIDSFSLLLSKMCVDGILGFRRADIFTTLFIEKLSYGLIISGLSMNLALSSRPASGSEHLVSHAIDEFFPEKSTMHGLQVSWAQMMIEKHLRKDLDEYERLRSFFGRIGLLQCIEENVPFNDNDFFDLLPLAKRIRNRYTVIDEYLNK
jgi:glycerol-1-phosphate dehydrogenase [NAD(P)+]